jgi:hypothetical protein
VICDAVGAVPLAVKLLVVSAMGYGVLLFAEDAAHSQAEKQRQNDRYGYVESVLLDFLRGEAGGGSGSGGGDWVEVLFNTEEIQPYVPTQPAKELSAGAALSRKSHFLTSGLAAMSTNFTFNRLKGKGETVETASSNISTTSPTEEGVGIAVGMDEQVDKAVVEPPRPEKVFEDFQFTDLSPAARDIYIDRRYTHNFQVRGPLYKSDGKKVHPGAAVCKCMLMELYEVEPKVTL